MADNELDPVDRMWALLNDPAAQAELFRQEQEQQRWEERLSIADEGRAKRSERTQELANKLGFESTDEYWLMFNSINPLEFGKIQVLALQRECSWKEAALYYNQHQAELEDQSMKTIEQVKKVFNGRFDPAPVLGNFVDGLFEKPKQPRRKKRGKNSLHERPSTQEAIRRYQIDTINMRLSESEENNQE